jgi:hypothetical protein
MVLIGEKLKIFCKLAVFLKLASACWTWDPQEYCFLAHNAM